MDKLELQYTLSYQEAYETFYVLASRRSSRTRIITAVLLTAIAIIMLVLFANNGIKIHYLFLAICSIALLFYVLYQPIITAKHGAAKVQKAGGKYRIILFSDGKIRFPNGEELCLKEDKYSRVIETENVFAMRIDAYHTVCVPKRILKEKDEQFIRALRGDQ